MRLTVRNLLAFMDDYHLPQGGRRLLSEDDFEALGQKIQNNEFAQDLMRRIRDVLRRSRLGAPSESDSGAGLDPNTVAEYLDHALPESRVPDFEKICLESDVHLAEVASCHQILAMVMREPAEVDEECRQRVYQLPQVLSDQAKEREALASEAETAEAPPERRAAVETEIGPQVPHSRVPEYLRRPPRSRRFATLLLSVAVLALIGVVAVLVNGVERTQQLVAHWLTGDQKGTTAYAPVLPAGGQGPEAAPAESAASVPVAAASPDVQREPGPSGQTAPAKKTAGPPPLPTPGGPEAPKAAKPAETIAEKGRPEAKGMPEKKATAKAGDAAGPDAPPPSQPAPAHAAAKPASDPGAPAKAPGAGVGEGAAAVQEVGRVASANQVLLRRSQKEVWLRVPDQAVLSANDRLVSLPAYRPRLSLTGGVSLQLVDAVDLTVLAPEPGGRPGVRVEFGRLLARADGAAGARLRVAVGDRSHGCQFADPDSAIAVEVLREEQSGSDPETEPAPLVAYVYVLTGKVLWQEQPTGTEVKAEAPVRLTVGGPTLQQAAIQQLPAWVSGDTSSPLDQRAAQVLERDLMFARSAVIELRALSSHRQREVRWLALRSLSLLEDYELLLNALGDVDQSRSWVDFIEQLRAAVFRSPHCAAKVRATMEQRFGASGAALYEMLWRYRPDTLQPEDAARLVEFLNHDELAFRVLSFWNLRNIANRTLYYRPEDPPAKRQTGAQKWKDLLKTTPTLRTSAPGPEADLEKGPAPPKPPLPGNVD